MHVHLFYTTATQKCVNQLDFPDSMCTVEPLTCIYTLTAWETDIKLADQVVLVLGQAKVNVGGIFVRSTSALI